MQTIKHWKCLSFLEKIEIDIKKNCSLSVCLWICKSTNSSRIDPPILMKISEPTELDYFRSKVKVTLASFPFLHLHEIVEGLYFYFSLSVCLCECEQNSSRTNAPIWMRFSLNSCLLHWLGPYWNWWPWVKGLGDCDRKCI